MQNNDMRSWFKNFCKFVIQIQNMNIQQNISKYN